MPREYRRDQDIDIEYGAHLALYEGAGLVRHRTLHRIPAYWDTGGARIHTSHSWSAAGDPALRSVTGGGQGGGSSSLRAWKDRQLVQDRGLREPEKPHRATYRRPVPCQRLHLGSATSVWTSTRRPS